MIIELASQYHKNGSECLQIRFNWFMLARNLMTMEARSSNHSG